MKNISDKTKKHLIISVGLIISIVLIVMIALQFKKEPVKEVAVPTQSTENSTVAADSLEVKETENTPAKISEDTQKGKADVDTGTEQKIQGDVPKKPTQPSSVPTIKPTTDKVEPSEPKDGPSQPTPPSKPTKQEKKTEPKTQTSGGLPGFDNVPDGGANKVTEAGEMYENGNKIGDMN